MKHRKILRSLNINEDLFCYSWIKCQPIHGYLIYKFGFRNSRTRNTLVNMPQLQIKKAKWKQPQKIREKSIKLAPRLVPTIVFIILYFYLVEFLLFSHNATRPQIGLPRIVVHLLDHQILLSAVHNFSNCFYYYTARRSYTVNWFPNRNMEMSIS